MIGGVTSLLSFVFLEWQISRVNSRIINMQSNVSHNEGNIQLLDKAVKFNSKKLEAVRHNQIQMGDTLTKLAVQLNNSIHLNNKNSEDIACI